MSGTRNTGLLTVYWKNRAKQQSFWDEKMHGKATRQKPLFKDDFMPLFINEEAEDYAQKMDPKLALAIAVRHKFFTKEISKSIKSESNPTKQVILLGSGYDTRAVRKKKYSQQFGVKFFEVDQNEVLNKKQKIYQQHQIDPNATYIGIDYIKADLIEELRKAGADFSVPTHIIWEGNTFYLTPEQIEKVLTDLKLAFTGQLFVSFDYIQKESNKIAEVKAFKQNLKEANAEMKSDVSDFKQEITEKLGFTVKNHTSCSEMTKEYGVGDNPYESQKNYYLCTLRK